jgi:hypothetical protein
MTDSASSRSAQLDRMMVPALLGSAIGAVVLVLCIFFEPGRHIGPNPTQVLRSWLFAWIFWFGISLGSMGLVMMHHLLGGGWAYLVRRFAEHAGAVVPVMAVLFIPVILGVHALYPWADPSQVADDPVLRHKAPMLNWPFWTVRAVIYFAIFTLLTWLLRSMSLAQDRSPNVSTLARLRRLSAGGEVVYFVVMSLAAVDWIMSREPHWFSTVFGFIVVIGQALTALCFLTLMLTLFSNESPLKEVIRPNYLNDLGSVMIMFVILWAYLSFAQFLVQWLGNQQGEITWWIRRTTGGWRVVGGALMVFHFLVPFVLLLQRSVKRNIAPLAMVAAGVLFMRLIDVLYWVTPSDPHHSPWGVGHWLYAEIVNLIAWITIGGVWLAAFIWLMKGRPLLPIGESIPVVPIDHGHGQRPISETLA